MTTSTATATPSGLGLDDRLARNARALIRIDAVLTTLAGLEMVLLPALFVRLHGLGATPLLGVRLLGLEWLLFGIWLLGLWSRPLTRGMARFAIAVLGLNALFLLVAPLAFGLDYSPLGWALTIGVVSFMDLICLSWWQVWRHRAA